MKSIGRFLQIFGMIVLPASMFMEASNFLGRDTGVSDMVIMMIFGVAAFGVGRIVEGYAQA